MNITHIHSPTNTTFRQLLKLTGARGIRKQGLALAAGEKIVNELLPSPHVQQLIISEKYCGALATDLPILCLDQALFRQLDVCGTNSPLVVVKWKPWPSFCQQNIDGHCVAIAFQDPENVGAVVRSSLAFGIEDVILLKECAHPFLPKAVRASAGTVFQARFHQGPPLESLHMLDFDGELVPLSQDGAPLKEHRFATRTMLLPGIEGCGLPHHLRSNAVSIPISDAVESLNAAVATSIILYAMQNQSDSHAPTFQKDYTTE
ncbi:TrmH family RNA methyltransferase [Desulfurispira natronophila]|uniref:TrmH family RNA methyltransferase n=1 Tax=Desulfurispira natronophila TaxID=682562 RepID=UPI001C851CA2|nr:RNA methyltransferase [Desulfurispira natronophila]